MKNCATVGNLMSRAICASVAIFVKPLTLDTNTGTLKAMMMDTAKDIVMERVIGVSDHLPECPVQGPRTGVYFECICAELRKAQERGTARAYDRALVNAKEALAALPKHNMNAGSRIYAEPFYVINREEAIVAINNLRSE